MAARPTTSLTWALTAAAAVVVAWAVYDAAVPLRGDAAAPRLTAERPPSLPEAKPSPLPETDAAPAPVVGPSAPAVDRFKLLGVIAGEGEGRALIAVDGQPARLHRVGDAVDGRLVVLGISSRGAVLGARDGGAELALAVTSSPTQGPEGSATPAAPPAIVVPVQIDDAPRMTPEMLRQLGSRHPPLTRAAVPASPASSGSGGDVSPPADDGRWRPSVGR